MDTTTLLSEEIGHEETAAISPSGFPNSDSILGTVGLTVAHVGDLHPPAAAAVGGAPEMASNEAIVSGPAHNADSITLIQIEENRNNLVSPDVEDTSVALGNKAVPASCDVTQKEREERIRATRERQAEEYRRKVAEMQEAMVHAQEVRKKQEQERRQRMEELKRREDEHRALVEERRKKLMEEENERRQAMMKRAAERCARLNRIAAKRTFAGPGVFGPAVFGNHPPLGSARFDGMDVMQSTSSITDSYSGTSSNNSSWQQQQRSLSMGNVRGSFSGHGSRRPTAAVPGKSCQSSESLLSSPFGTPARRAHSVAGARSPSADVMLSSFSGGKLPNYASPTVASQLRLGRSSEPRCSCTRYKSVSPEHSALKTPVDHTKHANQLHSLTHSSQSGMAMHADLTDITPATRRFVPSNRPSRATEGNSHRVARGASRRHARASSTPAKLRSSSKVTSPVVPAKPIASNSQADLTAQSTALTPVGLSLPDPAITIPGTGRISIFASGNNKEKVDSPRFNDSSNINTVTGSFVVAHSDMVVNDNHNGPMSSSNEKVRSATHDGSPTKPARTKLNSVPVITSPISQTVNHPSKGSVVPTSSRSTTSKSKADTSQFPVPMEPAVSSSARSTSPRGGMSAGHASRPVIFRSSAAAMDGKQTRCVDASSAAAATNKSSAEPNKVKDNSNNFDHIKKSSTVGNKQSGSTVVGSEKPVTDSTKTKRIASDVVLSVADKPDPVKMNKTPKAAATTQPVGAESEAARIKEEEYKQRLAEKRRLAREKAEREAAEAASIVFGEHGVISTPADHSEKQDQAQRGTLSERVVHEATVLEHDAINDHLAKTFVDNNLDAPQQAPDLNEHVASNEEQQNHDQIINDMKQRGNEANERKSRLNHDKEDVKNEDDVKGKQVAENQRIEEVASDSSETAVKSEEERLMKMDTDEKAHLEMDKREQERAEKSRREEEERLERKKRLESIMKRVKTDPKMDGNETPSSSTILSTSAAPEPSTDTTHASTTYLNSTSGIIPLSFIGSKEIITADNGPIERFQSPILQQLMSNKRALSPARSGSPQGRYVPPAKTDTDIDESSMLAGFSFLGESRLKEVADSSNIADALTVDKKQSSYMDLLGDESDLTVMSNDIVHGGNINNFSGTAQDILIPIVNSNDPFRVAAEKAGKENNFLASNDLVNFDCDLPPSKMETVMVAVENRCQESVTFSDNTKDVLKDPSTSTLGTDFDLNNTYDNNGPASEKLLNEEHEHLSSSITQKPLCFPFCDDELELSKSNGNANFEQIIVLNDNERNLATNGNKLSDDSCLSLTSVPVVAFEDKKSRSSSISDIIM